MAMPRFYFHLWNSNIVSIDREGIDLPSVTIAHREALICAYEISREMLVIEALTLNDAILEVVDHTDKTITTISLRGVATDPIHRVERGVHRHDVAVIGTRH
jgi:hypothetical protein